MLKGRLRHVIVMILQEYAALCLQLPSAGKPSKLRLNIKLNSSSQWMNNRCCPDVGLLMGPGKERINDESKRVCMN